MNDMQWRRMLLPCSTLCTGLLFLNSASLTVFCEMIRNSFLSGKKVRRVDGSGDWIAQICSIADIWAGEAETHCKGQCNVSFITKGRTGRYSGRESSLDLLWSIVSPVWKVILNFERVCRFARQINGLKFQEMVAQSRLQPPEFAAFSVVLVRVFLITQQRGTISFVGNTRKYFSSLSVVGIWKSRP